MSAGKKLSQEEAAARFSAAGLELRDIYVNQASKVFARCVTHGETHHVLPSNVFKGQRLKCCGNESRSIKHSGKEVAPQTRKKLSNRFSGALNPHYGKPRPDDVRLKVSQGLKRSASASVDYAINKARTGKTAGKAGIFYIADLGDGTLKFGSIVKMTVSRRIGCIREEYPSAQMALVVHVDDAGDYEASMMSAHRSQWIRGEYFRDFRE